LSVPNSFASVTTATGAQLDANFAAVCQLNALNILAKQGDVTKFSSASLPYREFVWDVTASGALYTLLGEFAIMGGSHNTALDATGTFLGRDATGACSFWVITASDKLKYYYSASQTIGTVPTWTLVDSLDLATGNRTVSGNLTVTGNVAGANVGTPPFFVRQFFPTF
jgi:hypothetical protein